MIWTPTQKVGNEVKKLDVVHNDKCSEFEKIFHRYDKALVVFWLPEKKRYSVWTKDKKGKAYMIYMCVTPDTKEYREPNEQDLKFIRQMDFYRKQKGYSLADELDKSDQKYEESEIKKLRDKMEAISKERWRFTFHRGSQVSVPNNPIIGVGG